MLEINNLQAGYGKKQVLNNISLIVNPGEIVSLVGPNGAGKSTVLRTIFGLIRPWSGEIRFESRIITGLRPENRIALGMALSPQGRRIFSDLTVRENLQIGGISLKKIKVENRIKMALEIFPALKKLQNKISGHLSGGEQQMVSLARALVTEPKLLLLDEPSLGLSPVLIQDIFDAMKAINRKKNVSILIVEQKVKEVLSISDRTYLIKLGKIALETRADDSNTQIDRIKKAFF